MLKTDEIVNTTAITENILRRLREGSLDVTAENLDTSGGLARCPVIGKPHGLDGAYIVHMDAPATLWWQNWVSGDSGSWCSQGGATLTIAEKTALQRRVASDRAKREAEQKLRHEEAARTAQSLYSASSLDISSHPYVIKKNLTNCRLVKRCEHFGHDCLMVPMYNSEGKITSAAFIGGSKVFGNNARNKTFLPGGKKGFHPIGPTFRGSKHVLIGEGIATVDAAVTSVGWAGVAAMDAGGLSKTAAIVRELAAPDADIVILADDDQGVERNPGLEAATAAAREHHCRVATPSMGKPADFWDLWHTEGPAGVKERIDAAVSDSGKTTAVVLCAADICPEPISWIWDGYLAAGKLHILGGAPGTGKTTLAISLAATISLGGRFPDGSPSQQGRVLIWSGEDDPTDTIVPRLVAAGACLDRIHILSGITEGEVTRPFDPATDVAELANVVRALGDVKLMIVDPVVSAVQGDSHKNAEVRRSLQPLVALGAKTGAAILGITHFSKGSQGRDATERIVGSVAFAALARVVLVTAKRQDTSARVFVRAKSNIGPDHGGHTYSLEQVELTTRPGVYASRVAWGETLDGEARAILAEAEVEPDDAVSEAKAFIKQLLRSGPVATRTVQAAAREAGISSATLRRGKKALGVFSERTGDAWTWVLPGNARCSTTSNLENLSTLSPLRSGAGSQPSQGAQKIQGAQGAQDAQTGNFEHLGKMLNVSTLSTLPDDGSDFVEIEL